MIEMLDGEPPNFSDSQIVAMDKIKVNPSPSPARAEVRIRHCLGTDVSDFTLCWNARRCFIDNAHVRALSNARCAYLELGD